MDRIIKANIDRYKKLLETEVEPVKRAMIQRLLREERVKREERAQRKAEMPACPDGAGRSTCADVAPKA